MLTPDRPPPEDYYQNNCRTLFLFVLDRYAHLLAERQVHGLKSYLALSNDGQRLFARILTRKGPCIRLQTLAYAEVSDVKQALQELAQGQFIAVNATAGADTVLKLLRKPELLDMRGNQANSRLLRKAELIDQLIHTRPDQQLLVAAAQVQPWLRVVDDKLWWLVRLLYFGDSQQDWSSFVLRDLGLIDYEQTALSEPQFADAKDLQEDLRYRTLSGLSTRLAQSESLAGELHLALKPVPTGRFCKARRERTLLRLGKWYEREHQWQAALAVYQEVRAHPARERTVRILHKQGRVQEALQTLQQMRSTPQAQEEVLFADRYGQRNGGFQPIVWEMAIDAASNDIESQALNLLYASGGVDWGYHVENSLICTLTGLLYWPVIFCEVPGAFTNPFQSGPNDLYYPDFVSIRADLLSKIERATTDDEGFKAHVRAIAKQKFGKANSLVHWQMLEQVSLERILHLIPIAHLRLLCGFLVRNLKSRRSGWPDLIVSYAEGGYELLEVKGPNDQLQPGQRICFSYLKQFGVPARVLKLKLKSTKSGLANE